MAKAKGLPALPSGDQSVVEPPGPIPNPEVKRHSADGSGTTGPVRVGRRQVYAPSIRENGRGFFLPAYQLGRKPDGGNRESPRGRCLHRGAKRLPTKPTTPDETEMESTAEFEAIADRFPASLKPEPS